MTYTIRSDATVPLALCEDDVVSSVVQNISVLLQTRKGTIPMYREYGIQMAFLDRPLLAAQTMMAAEIKQALEDFELRATLVNISFECPSDSPGSMVAILEVEIDEQRI